MKAKNYNIDGKPCRHPRRSRCDGPTIVGMFSLYEIQTEFCRECGGWRKRTGSPSKPFRRPESLLMRLWAAYP